jgi:hypothetical protein
MTDMPLAAWIAGAMAGLAFDAALRRVQTAALFDFCAGMAVLTKGIAGALPLLMLGVWRLVAPPARRRAPACGLDRGDRYGRAGVQLPERLVPAASGSRAGVVALAILAALVPIKAHCGDRPWGLPRSR